MDQIVGSRYFTDADVRNRWSPEKQPDQPPIDEDSPSTTSPSLSVIIATLMSKTVKVILTCDLDHDETVDQGVMTVEFGYEGERYSIELCSAHLDEYHGWMQDYVNHGTPAGRSSGATRGPVKKAATRRRSATPVAGASSDLAAIRAWARDNGYQVSDRGRISAEIRNAYSAAH
jgi:hypothetical protein